MATEQKDIVAVVTGGNRGIGYALVAALADRGYRVIFTTRDLDRGRQALARLGEERPARTLQMETCDLSSPASTRSPLPNTATGGSWLKLDCRLSKPFTMHTSKVYCTGM